MNFAVIIVAVYFAHTATALPYPEFVESEIGELFQLVPLERVRRGSVYGNVVLTDPGRVIVGAKGTPIDSANHQLNTHVFATDNIRHHSPLTVGGEANYLHRPSGATANLAGIRTAQKGSDLRASGQYNFFQDKNSNGNIEAFASKHIGGQSGNRPTDYGVQLNFKTDF